MAQLAGGHGFARGQPRSQYTEVALSCTAEERPTDLRDVAGDRERFCWATAASYGDGTGGERVGRGVTSLARAAAIFFSCSFSWALAQKKCCAIRQSAGGASGAQAGAEVPNDARGRLLSQQAPRKSNGSSADIRKEQVAPYTPRAAGGTARAVDPENSRRVWGTSRRTRHNPQC